jgi:ribosomal small subunit protein bTHX
MGKGDKKSKKGKIAKVSYGNSRKKNAIKARLKKKASTPKKPSESSTTGAKAKKTTRKKAEA